LVPLGRSCSLVIFWSEFLPPELCSSHRFLFLRRVRADPCASVAAARKYFCSLLVFSCGYPRQWIRVSRHSVPWNRFSACNFCRIRFLLGGPRAPVHLLPLVDSWPMRCRSHLRLFLVCQEHVVRFIVQQERALVACVSFGFCRLC
jgi:hypothetical protein